MIARSVVFVLALVCSGGSSLGAPLDAKFSVPAPALASAPSTQAVVQASGIQILTAAPSSDLLDNESPTAVSPRARAFHVHLRRPFRCSALTRSFNRANEP